MAQRDSLAACGGRIVETDGSRTVELRDPNDRAGRLYQYRRYGRALVERRVLQSNGEALSDGSPWEQMTLHEIMQLHMQRGKYHPILDPLGITAKDLMDEARQRRA